MNATPDCRLLGRFLDDTGFGIYTPGSEHADVTFAGNERVVLVPPKDLFASDLEGRRIEGLPVTGSHHRKAPAATLNHLRSLLASSIHRGQDGAVRRLKASVIGRVDGGRVEYAA